MSASLTQLFRFACLLGLTASLAACGKSAGTNLAGEPQSARPQAAPAQPQPAGFPSLPSLNELTLLAGTAPRQASAAGLWLQADQYQQLLPKGNVSIEPEDDSYFNCLTFAPQFDPAADPPQQELAYAVYRFQAMDTQTPPQFTMAFWDVQPQPGTVWLALANFATGRWEWRQCSGWPLGVALDSIEPYLNNGDCWCCVAITGTQSSLLRWVNLGEPDTSYFYVSNNLNNNKLLNIGPRLVTWSVHWRLPGAEIANVELDYDGDGTVDYSGPAAKAFQHNYEPGNYTFKLSMTDTLGRSFSEDEQFVIINPFNQNPVPKFELPAGGFPPISATLDASQSSDPDGSIIRYEWDVNDDGKYDFTGPQLEYCFTVMGSNTVRLRVTDNDLATATTTRQINLEGGWTKHTVLTGTNPTHGLGAAATKNGLATRISVAFRDYELDKLFFISSSDDAGKNWPTAPLDLHPAVSSAGFNCRVLPGPDANAFPQVYWGRIANSGTVEFYSRSATNSAGTSWSAVKTVDTGIASSWPRLSVANVGGNPTLVTAQGINLSQSDQVLLYQYDWAAQSWGSQRQVSPALTTQVDDLAIVDLGGLPLVAWIDLVPQPYEQRLVTRLATDSSGIAFNLPRLTRNVMGHDLTLANLAGGEPLAFCGRSYQGPKLSISHGSVDGLTWPEEGTGLTEGPVGSPSFCLYDGKPLLVYVSFTSGLYARAATDAGAASWGPATLLAAGIDTSPPPVLVRSSGIPVVLAYETASKTIVSFNYKPF